MNYYKIYQTIIDMRCYSIKIIISVRFNKLADDTVFENGN